MFIDRDKKKQMERKVVINEAMLRKIIRTVLEEALGSFRNQEEIGKYCADVLEDMVRNNIKKKTIKCDSDNIKKIAIAYLPNESIVGRFVSYDYYNKTVKIEVGRNIVERMSKEDIAYKISHELMHGNIYLSPKKYETSLKMELDVPEYYDNLVEMMGALDSDDIAYCFAYGLYSTFYQETQAMISQTSSEIKGIIRRNNIGEISRDDFGKLVTNCRSYNNFKLNITECCDVIDMMNDNQLKGYIIDTFSDFGIDIDVKFIRKMNKKIRIVSNEAMNKCMNNAMLVFYEMEKEGKAK